MDIRFEYYFTETGNFLISGFDPYRVNDDNQAYMDYYNKLFDDGEVKFEVSCKLRGWIVENNLSWACDAVTLFHAEQFAMNTKGNYTACYMWR